MTPQEAEAYKLLLKDKMTIEQAEKELVELGINIPRNKLSLMKQNAFNRFLKDQREEHMSELMLESFDRIKFEFEDLNSRTRRLLDQFEKEGKTFEQLIVIRELKDQLVIALKRLGEFKSSVMNVKANNVNILNTADFADAARRMQQGWFEKMNASYEQGKIVLNDPTPELIDDFIRWNNERLKKKAIPVGPAK